MINRRSFAALLGLAAATATTRPLWASPDASPLPTPLELSGYARLPKAAEVNAFLHNLAAFDPRAQVETLGRSAGGRELLAVVIGKPLSRSAAAAPDANKLTVMIVASQHGQEPSGAEATQAIARDLLRGPLQRHLAHLNVVIVPLANPDGRDEDRRVNAANVNLSTDFVLMTQPETRALALALMRYAPDVILDVHESAALKKQSLGAQGYLIDFQAQFDVANNPNVAPGIRTFSAGRFLPAIIAGVRAQGVEARHYIGEVTDIHQTITHAGLSIRNLRNYAGMRGAVSVLLENQLDPPGQYGTPRNIKTRVHKQYVGITTMLDRAIALRRQIREIVVQARSPATIAARKRIAFNWQYEPDPAHPTIRLPMRRLSSNEPFEKTFTYRPRIVGRKVAAVPHAYVLKDRRPVITEILGRHGIRYRRLTTGLRPSSKAAIVVIDKHGKIKADNARDGDLWVDVAQTGGLLVPLLLDPRSANGIYRYPPVATGSHQ